MLEEATLLCRRLATQGLVVASDGNASFRQGNQLYITRTRCEFGTLTVDDWCGMSLDGRPALDISSEWRMHHRLYKNFSNLGAVVHCHPPYATSFAVRGISLDGKLLTETADFGNIPVAPLAAPGSVKLADTVTRQLSDPPVACLLARHGALTVGGDFTEAVQRMERLEQLARIQWLVTVGKNGYPT